MYIPVSPLKKLTSNCMNSVSSGFLHILTTRLVHKAPVLDGPVGSAHPQQEESNARDHVDHQDHNAPPPKQEK